MAFETTSNAFRKQTVIRPNQDQRLENYPVVHRRARTSPQGPHSRAYLRCHYLIPSASIAALAASGFLLGACAPLTQGVGMLGHSLFGHTEAPPLTGNIGTVVADEPQAALVGHDVLARGGNAADAATATALALSVTLPSRASLGGGGACLVSLPDGTARSIAFLPTAATSAGGDRTAGTPTMLRGLYLMQAHFGSVDFNDTISLAQNLARNGITVSRILASDLTTVKTALLADENARVTFGKGESATLEAGDNLTQPRLAGFLERVRSAGVGDLYNGALAEVYVTAAQKAGGALNDDDLRRALPTQTEALTTTTNGIKVAFLAPPADGGLGAAARFATGASAQSVVAAWRQSRSTTLASAQAVLNSASTVGSAVLPPLPASTSFAITDRQGMAVACTLSDNNLFGTGRIAGNTGVILSASPATTPKPLLAAAAIRNGRTLRAILAASGQNEAADAVGNAARSLVANGLPAYEEKTGRLNAIICRAGTCTGSVDPRSAGLATGITN